MCVCQPSPRRSERPPGVVASVIISTSLVPTCAPTAICTLAALFVSSSHSRSSSVLGVVWARVIVMSTVPPFGLKRTTATRVPLLRPPAPPLPALDSSGSSW